MRAWVVAALAALVSPLLAKAQDTGAQYAPTNAQWLRRPPASEVAAAYPKSMSDLGKSLAVLAECRIGPAGVLEACQPLKSTVEAPDLKRSITQLAKGFAIDTRQAPELVGRFVIMPVVFQWPGTESLPLDTLTVGRSEYVVSDRREGARASLPCGGAAGACYLHAFGWEAAPDFGAVSRTLLKIGKTEGSSLVGCTADNAGTLTGCTTPPDFSTEQAALLQSLLALYRAPPANAAGVPVRGRQVVFTYDWADLAGVIKASALTRRR